MNIFRSDPDDSVILENLIGFCWTEEEEEEKTIEHAC